ncbi:MULTISPECIES: NtaA/DmoA family FMN-dependent monooxygenase [unclassified Rathayibacter]|uniref:NtaA/DmoA family FMN-dependent monooxygenase n=1 Tax=unclassified Rathayibacter TaxID=2609250 RepID=UPI000F4BF996|nr:MULTISPECIES: NtaA/DmoA family FMN-dependent monooxygenase [unclassified Rathayibacter]ROP49570.1 FMN-dependent oxidoreductase (nitrilotriacetate monooxygenase family) [Rathayibacter sp. PhB186]ROS51936.1 FMN-dependent oxidoreductase (nitrilotriacetate monooxygenase family) [Rathayibacter sp. PhB185]
MTDPRPLLFNAFVMNTPSHIHHGQWRRPGARPGAFEDLGHWIEVARTLERGVFDAIFFADVVGTYGAVGASLEVNAREGLQLPNNDPSILLAALIGSTEHLGLAMTSSILQAHPFEFARRMSTLDHLSKGRVAWNIVTSYQENAARNFGLDRLTEHDARYVQAEEYLDVVYKLWEGSWDDDASVRDQAGAYSRPESVHRIDHAGASYRVEGPHLSAPSPQRTPFLFQAGSSPAGRAFAARHAEAQFVGGSTTEQTRELIASTRALTEAAGRRGDDVLFFSPLSVIVGSTEREAREREAELDAYSSVDAHLLHAGLSVDQADGTPFPPETRLRDIVTNGNRSTLESMIRLLPDRDATVADLARLTVGRHQRVVGTPEQIADRLSELRDAGVDGINLNHWSLPDSYVEFVDEVMPVLRARGLARSEYAPGGLRERLTGSARLNPRHPAARYRGAFRG